MIDSAARLAVCATLLSGCAAAPERAPDAAPTTRPEPSATSPVPPPHSSELSTAAPPPSVSSSVEAPTPQVGRSRGAPASAAQAIAQFRASWSEEIVPGATTEGRRRLVDGWSEAIAGQKLDARRVDCAEGHTRVRDTLGPSETDLVLFSSIQAFDRSGPCWEIVAVRGFHSVLGYIDAKTGALVFAWLVPEG
jgi:hypothetical protein